MGSSRSLRVWIAVPIAIAGVRQELELDIPVICEKAPNSSLPDIDKKKFLVPGTMLVGEFKYIIHKPINQTATASIASDVTIYLFVGSTSPKTGSLMSEVY